LTSEEHVFIEDYKKKKYCMDVFYKSEFDHSFNLFKCNIRRGHSGIIYRDKDLDTYTNISVRYAISISLIAKCIIR